MLNTCGLSALLFLIISPKLVVLNDANCAQLYENGVEAYLENRYDDCVKSFELALSKYRLYMKHVQNCRLVCKEAADHTSPLYPVDIDDLFFYERTLKQTLCLVQCKNENQHAFGDNFHINPETERLFDEQKPFDYLHLCYYQTKQYQKAASAAFTYLVSHPDDRIIQTALKQYAQMENVDMKAITNYVAEDYVYLYIHGADSYEKKDWRAVVEHMDESLESYRRAEEQCRAQCEGPFDPGWYPDFIPSISNHFTYCLKCKQKCARKLNSLNGEVHDDLLASHFHYLQYAYFKLGDIESACRAVANYLLFYPDDETMLSNKKYYLTLPTTREEFFTPDDETLRYIHRERYEKKLLKFIETQFNFTEPMKEVLEDYRPSYRIVASEAQLNGSDRFVADGLATRAQCKLLIGLARAFAVSGDGYDGKQSPHTLAERFAGVTLTRAILLTYYDLIGDRYLRNYLQVTESVRQRVRDYFQLHERPLHFSFTHLVCRSALGGWKGRREEYSHAIHADNCNVQPDGRCERGEPAYTWRDYSAILYLNGDFDGGEFVFAADPLGARIQSVVEPRCGRLVGFSSGGENLHGVKAVRNGSRCAIAVWFTFNGNYTERVNRQTAYRLVNDDI